MKSTVATVLAVALPTNSLSNPVQLERSPEVGVPNAGVTNVGEVEKTRLVLVVPVAPEDVYPVILLKAVILAELAFVPPLATGNTPVTPVVMGKPVQLVKVPLVGVPIVE